jgi:hypothetical protein
MAGEVRDLMNRLSQPPTKEEWELRQRQQILERWHRIALDLAELVKCGRLLPDTPIKTAIETLLSAIPEDIPVE